MIQLVPTSLNGHLVTSRSSCAQAMMSQFIDQPDAALETSCLDPFNLPFTLTSADVLGEFATP